MKSTKRGFYRQQYGICSFTLSSVKMVWLVFNALILLSSCSATNLHIEPLNINETNPSESNKYDVIGILGSMEFPQKKIEAYFSPRLRLKFNTGDKFLAGAMKGFGEGIQPLFMHLPNAGRCGRGTAYCVAAIVMIGSAYAISRSVVGGITNSIVFPKPQPKNESSSPLQRRSVGNG